MSITWDAFTANRSITGRTVDVSADPYVYASEFTGAQIEEPTFVIVKDNGGVPIMQSYTYEANSGDPRIKFFSDLTNATITWL